MHQHRSCAGSGEVSCSQLEGSNTGSLQEWQQLCICSYGVGRIHWHYLLTDGDSMQQHLVCAGGM